MDMKQKEELEEICGGGGRDGEETLRISGGGCMKVYEVEDMEQVNEGEVEEASVLAAKTYSLTAGLVRSR